ncbi:MAG: hypothetical protein LBP76_11000 [Treponema sp.]|jgi:hypothetical protein|nr:hypothetical protein [Treponema sp.]
MYTLANGTLTINIDFTQSEFILHCVKLIDYDGIETIEKIIVETLTNYLIGYFNNIEFFSNTKFLGWRREDFVEYKGFINLSDCISKYGGLRICFYKLRTDCVINSGIEDIKLILPSFIKMGNWFSLSEFFQYKNDSYLKSNDKYIYTKKKILKTKEKIKLDILGIGFDSYFLNTLQRSMPKKDYFIDLRLSKGLVYVNNDGTKIAKESLPYPIVVYPESGCFISFKKSIECDAYYCSCFENAIANYNKHEYTRKIINPQFANLLCHECNKKLPSISYYGPTFPEKFLNYLKWYIDKRVYEKGLDYASNDDIENEVRLIFGFRKKGEEWIGETMSYYKIKEAFSETEVIHHGKPDWLGRQHLDVWIPKYDVAIEYQGKQHDEAIEYFGGEEGLQKTKERDETKFNLCLNNNTKLFYIYSVEDIESVISDIKIYLNSKESVREFLAEGGLPDGEGNLSK